MNEQQHGELALPPSNSKTAEAPTVSIPNSPQVELPPNPATAAILTQTRTEVTAYSGPLPPPEVLQGYDDIHAGLALRIVAMAEKQQEHRMSMEKAVVEAGNSRADIGLQLGFLVAIAIIVLAGFAAYLGHTNLSYGLVASALIPVCGLFIFAHLNQRKEREEKAKTMSKLKRESAPPPVQV